MKVGCNCKYLKAAILVFLLFPIAASSHPPPRVVDWVWDHIGGRDEYGNARYLEFTWAHETDGEIDRFRKHTWDRYKGDYVIEFTDAKTNDSCQVFFNIYSKSGVALRNGAEVGDEERAELVDRAYRMFINDTYWLLLPAKLQDPGARLKFVGHEGVIEGGEGEWVILHLFFGKPVGLTPGDEYWIYVTHSGEITRWRYVLEDGDEGDWEWLEEKDCGMGLIFSTRKVSGNKAIVFPSVKFSETMDRSVFQYTPDQ